MDDILENLLQEEKELQFESFNEEIAWEIGNRLVERAIRDKLPITIDITRGGHQLFHAARPGTSADNDEWVKRKVRLVYRLGHSSFYAGQFLKNMGKTIEEVMLIPESEYAPHGGCFPVIVKGTGMVGTITVSGLNQTDAVSFGLEDVQEKLKQYQENVETWFDHNMGKLSGWYKENAMTMAFIIGLGLAFIFNVDTINITQRLWREPTIRQALVAQADTYELEDGVANITEVRGYFDSLAMPIGWTSVPAFDASLCKQFISFTAEGSIAYQAGNECRVLANIPRYNDIWGWIIKLLGFALSAFAARQGAPFWFDLLKRLVSLRSTTQQTRKEEAKG